MTKAIIEKAAKLWSLTLVANCDEVGEFYQEDVRRAAIKKARDKLHKMGYFYGDLLDEKDCVEAVQKREKTKCK